MKHRKLKFRGCEMSSQQVGSKGHAGATTLATVMQMK